MDFHNTDLASLLGGSSEMAHKICTFMTGDQVKEVMVINISPMLTKPYATIHFVVHTNSHCIITVCMYVFIQMDCLLFLILTLKRKKKGKVSDFKRFTIK